MEISAGAVLILCPLLPSRLSETLLPRGCSPPGKGTQSEFMERRLGLKLVRPLQDQSHWGGASLCGGGALGRWSSGLCYMLVETGPHWGGPERLGSEFQHPALKPREILVYFYFCGVWGVGP